MKLSFAILAAGLALLAPPAHAEVTFEYLFDGGHPLSVSSDGSVVTGTLNSGGFPAFRWTQATGPVHLGRVMHSGGAGVPAISADGTRIAFGIATLADSMETTQGLWTLGSGWQELMPPTPPDGGLSDGSYGSVWGLSGDGNTVVGLYWRPGVGNRAHASKWTQATGVVDLGGTITGQASRANGVNFDGSVIVGWVETPTGPWRPAAWVDGSLVLLTDYDDSGMFLIGHGEARATSTNGDIIVGYSGDPDSHQRAASMWKRTDGVFGPTEILGWVDGTTPGSPGSSGGINIAHAVSDDGEIAVGYCSFDGDPFFTTGFVWTQDTGVLDVNVFLANNGVFVDPNFAIKSLNAITPDGTQIFGFGQMLTSPFTRKAFRITTSGLVAVPAPNAPVANIELSAPIPNPSSSSVRLDFALETASSADLSIYDTAGRRVATVLHADLPPGRRSVTWDGRGTDGLRAGAGLYFARLTTEKSAVARQLVRVR